MRDLLLALLLVLLLLLLALLLALLLLILLALLLLAASRAAGDLVGLILVDVEIPDLVLILLIHLVPLPSWWAGRTSHFPPVSEASQAEYPPSCRSTTLHGGCRSDARREPPAWCARR